MGGIIYALIGLLLFAAPVHARMQFQTFAASGSVASAWTPASLGANLIIWQKHDDTTKLFTDSAKTTAVSSDGDVIGAHDGNETVSNDFIQATTELKPTYQSDAGSLINGHAVMRLDGTNDRIVNGTNISSASAGTVFAIFRTGAALQNGIILSSADAVTSNFYHLIMMRQNGANYQIAVAQKNDDVFDIVHGSTNLAVNTVYYAVWSSSGTAYTLYLNGSAETPAIISGANTGDWWGDTTSRDNFSVGSIEYILPEIFLKGDILEVGATDVEITGGTLTSLQTYLAGRSGL